MKRVTRKATHKVSRRAIPSSSSSRERPAPQSAACPRRVRGVSTCPAPPPTFRVVGQRQQADAGRPDAGAERRDAVGVSSEEADVLADPPQRRDLVQQAVVPLGGLVPGAQEACSAQGSKVKGRQGQPHAALESTKVKGRQGQPHAALESTKLTWGHMEGGGGEEKRRRRQRRRKRRRMAITVLMRLQLGEQNKRNVKLEVIAVTERTDSDVNICWERLQIVSHGSELQEVARPIHCRLA
ncbi:hypothetical protein EYF80_050921 [Liparis tanakae]|uniref:Uncharacterized protein n=1 Tax=Liparis tanakae TaxID=230148 RepID=A0A4Z2FDC1_9TELE|nr:hypothetical protein EYF80_050921 [Liparis tanakae]